MLASEIRKGAVFQVSVQISHGIRLLQHIGSKSGEISQRSLRAGKEESVLIPSKCSLSVATYALLTLDCSNFTSTLIC